MDENVVIEEKNNKVKKIVVGVIVIAVIVAIIVGIVNLLKPTPEKTVKKAIKLLNKGDFAELSELIDVKGMVAYSSAYGDTDEFNDTYDDLDEDWDDIEDDVQDAFDSSLDEMEDDIMDLNEFSVEIKEIKKGKKVSDAKKLYKVKAELKIIEKTDDDTERSTDDYEIYLLKENGKYYIVGIEGGEFDYYSTSFYSY